MPSEYPVRIDRRVFVPAADGTTLALTTYLPDALGDGPFPAVLESLPYRKDDDCTARDWQTFSYLAARGIAGVRLDIRGTGASDGVIDDEYTEIEQHDNIDVLRWMAAQDWCTGRLGMWGISWGGFSALQTAMLRPPELEAICAMHATHDRFACDVHYSGGSLHVAESVDWPGSMVPLNALPPDPDIVGDRWFDMWMERLAKTPQWLPIWLRHQHRDDYWLHGSPCADYASITASTLLIGGWLDPYVDGILAMLEHLDAPRRAVIGPWGHYRPATGVPAPTYDHLDLITRWFGHHLRDDDNGVMDEPVATFFIRTAPPYDADRVSGHWRAEPSWPPSDAAAWELRLADLNSRGISWDGPQWVGHHAPFWDRGGWGSTPDDSAHEAMTFETEPLQQDVEILGTVQLEITVTVDKPVGLVAARLLAVAPDATAHLICRGNRNLAFPSDLASPTGVTPDEPMMVRIPLVATSAVVPAGWRLRIAIAGADFPILWPPGERVTMHVDAGRSRVFIPVVPPRPFDRTLDITESPSPPETNVQRVASTSEWRTEIAAGIGTFTKRSGHTEFQPERAGLTYSSDQRIEISVAQDDPSSLRALSTAEASLNRPGWDVGATGALEISADAAYFHVAVDLSARHDGVEIWSREVRDSIPREWA